MALKLYFVCLLFVLSQVKCFNKIDFSRGIDQGYLENVLNKVECRRQITAIRRNSRLFLEFADSGLRTPRGVLMGNEVDLGNYFQCTGINYDLEDMKIQGKHCFIRVPFNQSFGLPSSEDMQGLLFNPSSLRLDDATMTLIEENKLRHAKMLALSRDFSGFEFDRSMPETPLSNTVFRLSVCVPKPCTSEQAINSFFFNISAVGFRFTEDYCRVPGDKTWVAADYVAIGFFALLGFLTLLSTCYDLTYRFLLKKDIKQIKTIYQSFSVYTNGQRLITFNYGAGTLQCLDGIRTLAMVWVIVGHSFSTEPFIANRVDSTAWMFSADALWITAATMTVDTFFTLAGVLLVYTTAGKMNQKTFFRNLHWFYLNRYMRVTPLLAVAVLLQAAYYNRMFDGPHWVTVSAHTQNCRNNWWSTLLHVQNYVHPNAMCVTHSWYIAIDFQLYLVSPLVLFWVYSNKKNLAWMGLTGGLVAILIASTIYCFNINLQAGTLVPTRFPDMRDYFEKYYFNTLTRASPFFVGLIAGYILHIYRKKKIQIPWFVVILLWTCFAGILAGIFYFKYRIKQFDWDNQLMDNIMNSFMRPTYACAICWLIIACVHGYSGPINWFLSHEYWRLPARLSYGMFLFHYPLMYAINASTVAPVYFSVGRFTFKFLSYLVLSVVYSFVLTLLVDSPVTVLFKQLMDSVKGKKPLAKAVEVKKEENGDKIPNGVHKKLSVPRVSLKENGLNSGYTKNYPEANSGADVLIKSIDISDVKANPRDIKSNCNGVPEIINNKEMNVTSNNINAVINPHDVIDVESNLKESQNIDNNDINVNSTLISNGTVHADISDEICTDSLESK